MRCDGRYGEMKRVLAFILISITLLLAVSSCTMVKKGELRLLNNMEILDPERLRTNVQFWVRVYFEAEGQPEIRRACFYWTGDGPHCVPVPVKDIVYGSVAYFEVPLSARFGTNSLQCYVEYLRDEKTERSNAISSSIEVLIP
jgi:hypothetical protein